MIKQTPQPKGSAALANSTQNISTPIGRSIGPNTSNRQKMDQSGHRGTRDSGCEYIFSSGTSAWRYESTSHRVIRRQFAVKNDSAADRS